MLFVLASELFQTLVSTHSVARCLTASCSKHRFSSFSWVLVPVLVSLVGAEVFVEVTLSDFHQQVLIPVILQHGFKRELAFREGLQHSGVSVFRSGFRNS